MRTCDTVGSFHLLLYSTWNNWRGVLLGTKHCLSSSRISSDRQLLGTMFLPAKKGEWHDASSLCFGFPLHLDSMAFGARTALVVLQTLLKSLKCNCIKIKRRNHKHIHMLIIMQSREGEGRKYEIPLKSCQHRSKYKRCLKWVHTVPDWRITNIPVTLV